jgi:endogenous inhibitor of DNA gyrase (YacG/DUF329 family)
MNLCKICGKEYENGTDDIPLNFCSKDCFSKRKCKNCGKVFILKNKTAITYCSQTCARAGAWGQLGSKKYPKG